MRTRYLSFFVFGVALIAGACSKYSSTTKDKSMVSVELVCSNGGISSFKVDPYTAAITDRTKHFTWTLTNGSSVVEAVIGPKGTNAWPFAEGSYSVKPGNPARSRTIKGGTPEGTYKYSISAICSLDGGKQDTVSIDPDMIIPRET